MMMHKNKRTNKSKRGFFWAVTIDTTNKGSRPEIHARVGGRVGWTIGSSFHRVDLIDTTNKRFLLDTTNKGFLLTLTMMNFRGTILLR
jgi:hypothetical protein